MYSILICNIRMESENYGHSLTTSADKNIKTSFDTSDLTKDSKDENVNTNTQLKVKYKVKKKGNRINTSKDKDSNLTEESQNKDVCKVKCKDEDIQNKAKITQNKSDTKKIIKNKYTCKDESEDEDIEDEYYSDATYIAQQKTSTEKLHYPDSIRLYNLRVQLRHTVPPQHKIEKCAGSHMPTRAEISEFEKIIPIKRGLYSLEEDKIIAKNWKTFCKLHDWDVKMTRPFLQLRDELKRDYRIRKKIERRKFVQFLADGLPDRTLYSVYHRFRNLYENNVQRRYKPEEDIMILNHLENNPSLNEKRKYVDLAKALQRTRHSIWRRYRILKKKKCKD
ncbi:uncharacterized protein LOC105828623 isoform X2 [Monomorium pharaonis]|uniref:uncharacterized protein LOC105828623 isoform X2 n=1 Tax=Monomorium pharaonis TaxID=307658 RepID=UPI0017475529|nr:uncharacterized protein LOC105828623 isoform X2 [Monomorium pharaonis]